MFIEAAKYNLFPRLTFNQVVQAKGAELKVRLWGLEFDNPIGVAAGLDKHAEGMDALLNLGALGDHD